MRLALITLGAVGVVIAAVIAAGYWPSMARAWLRSRYRHVLRYLACGLEHTAIELAAWTGRPVLSVRRILQQLEDVKLVASRWDYEAKTRRYAITMAGQKFLARAGEKRVVPHGGHDA